MSAVQIWKRKSYPPKKSRDPECPVFFLLFVMKKIVFIKHFLKGFRVKRKNVLFEKACQKKRLSCLRINTGKNTFFVFFPRFSNFFERVFALNNVFSFLEKITFWGEHLTKITCQIKFFSNLQWHQPKKSRFLKSLFFKIYKNLKNMHRESIFEVGWFSWRTDS